MKKVKNINQFKTQITEEGRVCTKCKQFKTWENFRKVSKPLATGRTSECIECSRNRVKATKKSWAKYDAKSKKKELKKENPFLYKARLLRSRLISRVPPEIKASTPTGNEIYEWLLNQPLVCYYSGEALELFKMHVDHKTPIVRGGTNDFSNLCLASHHMNTAKGRMTEQEFRELLALIETWEDKGDSLMRRLKQGHFG